MLFSQRLGHSSVRAALQVESMDSALRNSLWNALQEEIWDTHKSSTPYQYTSHSNLFGLIKAYWRDLFKTPIDQIPNNFYDAIKSLRSHFFNCEWFQGYDFIEFTCSRLGGGRKSSFVVRCNQVLTTEMAGYRLIDGEISPIVSESDIEAIEEALNGTTTGAHTHLKRALQLLSDRTSPDFRNSIKESISAVEAVAQEITGDRSATLGAALKVISGKAPMHPALNKSLSSLYGYTSDSAGIRHALLDESDLDFVDAKFMLVACAAFINYLNAKSAG